MAKVSIIIPSRNEVFKTKEDENILIRTVRDIYEKATGDFEVIIGFDGPPYLKLPKYPNLRILKLPEVVGIKTNINILAIMAKGKYIYKSDAHCMFDKGFDEKLQADMQDNWVVTPRFYVLDGYNWKWQDDRFYDYFYLCCPFTDPRGFRFKAGGHWPERTKEREGKPEYLIDETMQFHGSGWFVNRDFFINKIGGYWTRDPEGHAQEGPHLGLKTWLGPWGGKVMVNKKTWYAHMHQQTKNKGFDLGRTAERNTYTLYANYWMGNHWGDRVQNLSWLIEKFWPVPTWPENWNKIYKKWLIDNGRYQK